MGSRTGGRWAKISRVNFSRSHVGSLSVTAEICCFYPDSISASWHARYNVSQISWMYSIQSSTLREHMLPSCAPLKPRQSWKLLTGRFTAKTPQLTSGHYILSIHLGKELIERLERSRVPCQAARWGWTNTKHWPKPVRDEVKASFTQTKAVAALFCSSFNTTRTSGSDKTAATAAHMLIPSAAARLAATPPSSSFFSGGNLQHSLSSQLTLTLIGSSILNQLKTLQIGTLK